MSQAANRVERWFADHAGDGEFELATNLLELPSVPSSGTRLRTVYTTKPAVLRDSHFADSAELPSPIVLGQYGLPDKTKICQLDEWLGADSLEFLGDLDPPDLLIFTWLRDHLGSQRCRYAGLSDRLWEDIHGDPTQFKIALSAAERAAWPLVRELLPDSQRLLGSGCWALLESGFKVELESLRWAIHGT